MLEKDIMTCLRLLQLLQLLKAYELRRNDDSYLKEKRALPEDA